MIHAIFIILLALLGHVFGQPCAGSSDYSVQYGSNAPYFVVSQSNGSCYCREWIGRHVGDGSGLTNLTAQPEVADLRAQLAAQSLQMAAQAAQIDWLMARLTNLTNAPGGGTTGFQPATPNSARASINATAVISSWSLVPVTGMAVNITTSGYPVLVFANADVSLLGPNVNCSFSIYRDGVNLGLARGLGQVSDNGVNGDLSWSGIMAIDNAPPAGLHTYEYYMGVSGASGAAASVKQQSTTPTIAAVELNKPNLNWAYATTTTVTTFIAQSWTPAVGLSFTLPVTATGAPVLLFANVPWICDDPNTGCWVGQSFLRNGVEISGQHYGYGVNYVAVRGRALVNGFVAIDFPPVGTHNYSYACRVGSTPPIGVSRTNNDVVRAWVAGIGLSSTTHNFGYAAWNETVSNAQSSNIWSPLGDLTTTLTTAGAVFLYSVIDHNPSSSASVTTAYTIFRDGINLGDTNGLTVCSAQPNYNELCNVMLLDNPSPGLHNYTVNFKTLTPSGGMFFNDVTQAYNLVAVDLSTVVNP